MAPALNTCSLGDTIDKFFVAQTCDGFGPAWRSGIQEARKWSDSGGRGGKAEPDGPPRGLRADNETLRGKGKKGRLPGKRPHRQRQRGGDGPRTTERGPRQGGGRGAWVTEVE